MNTIFRYLFSSIIMVGSGVMLYQALLPRSTSFFSALTSSDHTAQNVSNTSNRSLQRAARYAEIERNIEVVDPEIPVHFQIVNQEQGHVPVVQLVQEPVKEQILVDKQSQVAQQSTPVPYHQEAYAPATNFYPESHFNTPDFDQNHGYVPEAYSGSHSAGQPLHNTQLQNIAPSTSAKSDHAGAPLPALKSTESEPEDRLIRPRAKGSYGSELSEDNINRSKPLRENIVSNVMPSALPLQVSKFSWLSQLRSLLGIVMLPWNTAYQMGCQVVHGMKNMLKTNVNQQHLPLSESVVTPISEESSADDLQEGAFVPLMLQGSDRSSTSSGNQSTHSGTTLIESNQVQEAQPNTLNSIRSYFSGPMGAWHAISVATKAFMLGALAYAAHNAYKSELMLQQAEQVATTFVPKLSVSSPLIAQAATQEFGDSSMVRFKSVFISFAEKILKFTSKPHLIP